MSAFSHLTDETLVSRTLRGEREAFSELMRRYERLLFSVAFRILNDAGLAQDAVQEAFLRAFRNLGSFRGDAKVGTWLRKVGVNVALNMARTSAHKAARAAVPLDDPPNGDGLSIAETTGDSAPNPEEAAVSREALGHLQEALAEIPVEFRTALVLREVQGLDYAEIAEILEIPAGTVKSRIARARTEIRERLRLRGVTR